MTTFSANRATVRRPAVLLLLGCTCDMTAYEHTQYFIKLTRNIRTTNINKCLSNICKYIHVVLLVIIKLIKFRSRELVCSRVSPPLRVMTGRSGPPRAVDARPRPREHVANEPPAHHHLRAPSLNFCPNSAKYMDFIFGCFCHPK